VSPSVSDLYETIIYSLARANVISENCVRPGVILSLLLLLLLLLCFFFLQKTCTSDVGVRLNNIIPNSDLFAANF
jgi:hypothetical protein